MDPPDPSAEISRNRPPQQSDYALSGILFPKNTAPGTYTMTFTGGSGSLKNSTTAKFTVVDE